MKPERLFGKSGSARRRVLAGSYLLIATLAVATSVEWLARARNGFGYVRSTSPRILYMLGVDGVRAALAGAIRPHVERWQARDLAP